MNKKGIFVVRVVKKESPADWAGQVKYFSVEHLDLDWSQNVRE
jgi:hypothetical protein